MRPWEKVDVKGCTPDFNKFMGASDSKSHGRILRTRVENDPRNSLHGDPRSGPQKIGNLYIRIYVGRPEGYVLGAHLRLDSG